jgi:hypothetical protein
MPAMIAPPSDLVARLERIGQSHVLAAYDRLGERERAALLEQVRAIDLDVIPELVRVYVKGKPGFVLPADVKPAPYYPNDPTSAVKAWDRDRARAKGLELINAGKVACFTVAGRAGNASGL